jgi:hypothetical protein
MAKRRRIEDGTLLKITALSNHFRRGYARRCIHENSEPTKNGEAEYLAFQLLRTQLLVHISYGDSIPEEVLAKWGVDQMKQESAQRIVRKIIQTCRFSDMDEVYFSSEFEYDWLIAQGLVKS